MMYRDNDIRELAVPEVDEAPREDRTAELIAEYSERSKQIRGTAGDELVTLEVDCNGMLTEIKISPSASQTSTTALEQSIMSCFRTATERVTKAREETLAALSVDPRLQKPAEEAYESTAPDECHGDTTSERYTMPRVRQ